LIRLQCYGGSTRRPRSTNWDFAEGRCSRLRASPISGRGGIRASSRGAEGAGRIETASLSLGGSSLLRRPASSTRSRRIPRRGHRCCHRRARFRTDEPFEAFPARVLFGIQVQIPEPRTILGAHARAADRADREVENRDSAEDPRPTVIKRSRMAPLFVTTGSTTRRPDARARGS